MTNNRKPVGRPFNVSRNIKNLVRNNRKLSIVEMPQEIIRVIGSFIKDDETLFHYTASCKTVHNFFHHRLDDRAFEKAAQALLDGREEELKKILDCQPWLVEREPKKDMVIESQLTWQRFYAEKLLPMALKLGRFTMVKLILPCFKELENGPEIALEQWKKCETSEEEKKKKEQQYAEKMKALTDIIAKETFAQDTGDNRLIDGISETTKEKLETFRKELLPDKAIKLDMYVDVEQLLSTGYQAYIDHPNKFQDQGQRDRHLYCNEVIGMIQRVLSPELAEIYCEGLKQVIFEKKQISDRAKRFEFVYNNVPAPFYRSSRDSLTDLEFDFNDLARICGVAEADLSQGPGMFTCFAEANVYLKHYIESKQLKLKILKGNFIKEALLHKCRPSEKKPQFINI